MSMKSLVVSAVSGLLCLAPVVSNAAGTFQFNGEVQKDSLRSSAYGLSIKLGQVAMFDMPGELKLQIATPKQDDERAVAVVRLLRPTAGPNRYEILHEARTVGASGKERSISYLVCGEQVTFLTPAPQVTPTCPS